MKVIIMMKYKKFYQHKILKINNTLIETYIDMLKNLHFEQNRYSLTSTGISKIAHDNIKVMKWICYYDRSYSENINFFDLMGGICIFLKIIFRSNHFKQLILYKEK